jgi:glycosyltransferase involved in cell wall biosynthesis
LPIAKKRLAGGRALHGWLKANNYDVVNTHSSTDSWLAALALACLGRPFPMVRTRHISAAVPTDPLTRWLYSRATARIVTTGEALRRQLIETNGFSAERIVSVPTGIDTSRFRPGDSSAARAQLGLPRNAPLIGIVATLRSWKGHAYLVEALGSLPSDVRLVIVGAGPGWEPLHEQVAALGLRERVIFAGDQRDVVPWLQAFDLFALPSYANEGVPQAILQAMACERPVVTTSVGAISEAVAEGVSGVFVPPRDSAALARAIKTLLADAPLRNRFGAAARKRVLERHSMERMLDAMEAVFCAVAAVR